MNYFKFEVSDFFLEGLCPKFGLVVFVVLGCDVSEFTESLFYKV